MTAKSSPVSSKGGIGEHIRILVVASNPTTESNPGIPEVLLDDKARRQVKPVDNQWGLLYIRTNKARIVRKFDGRDWRKLRQRNKR